MRRQGFERVNGWICSFMDEAGKALEDTPDLVSKVKVKQIKIMDFGDGMDVMSFECDGEEGGFEDAVEHTDIGYRIKWNNFQRGQKQWSSDARLYKHGKIK